MKSANIFGAKNWVMHWENNEQVFECGNRFRSFEDMFHVELERYVCYQARTGRWCTHSGKVWMYFRMSGLS